MIEIIWENNNNKELITELKNDIEHIIKQHKQRIDNKIKELNQSQNN